MAAPQTKPVTSLLHRRIDGIPSLLEFFAEAQAIAGKRGADIPLVMASNVGNRPLGSAELQDSKKGLEIILHSHWPGMERKMAPFGPRRPGPEPAPAKTPEEVG